MDANTDVYGRYLDADADFGKYKKTCECGCVSIVPANTENDRDYITCRWCGMRIYKDDEKQKEYNEKIERERFRMKMWNAMRGSKRNSRKVNRNEK